MVTAALRMRMAGRRGTVLAYDTFNRADGAIGTSTSGHAWTQAGGNIWVVTGNQLGVSADTDGSLATLDAGAADMWPQVKITTLVDKVGIVARFTDTTHFHLMVVNGDGSLHYNTNNGGYGTEVATGAGTVVVGDVVGLFCKGTTVRGTVNGAVRLTGAASIFTTATKAGLRNGAGGGTSKRMDDFYVYST